MGRPHFLIIRTNPHLRDHFKAWCAKRRQSMTDALNAFMKTAIKEDDEEDRKPKKGK